MNDLELIRKEKADYFKSDQDSPIQLEQRASFQKPDPTRIIRMGLQQL